MHKALLLSAALLGLSAMSANAAVVGNLGNNPTSATGHFDSPIGGTGFTGSGGFNDQILFTISGGPAFLTIASATNVYAKPSDFITNFTGSVWFTNNNANPADDIRIIGPVAATACVNVPNCQGFAGSTILTQLGLYYLELDGSGGGSSGYGGNLAVAQVPLPGAAGLFLAGMAGIFALRRRKQKSLNVA